MRKRGDSGFHVEWTTLSIRKLMIVMGLFAATSVLLFRFALPQEKASEPAGPPSLSGMRVATFLDLEGTVEIKTKETYEWSPANLRMGLLEGTMIHVGDKSSARLEFLTGLQITLGSNTIVRVQASETINGQSQPIANVDTGVADINADASNRDVMISSHRIPVLILAPGTIANLSSDERKDAISVSTGQATVRDSRGERIMVENHQQLQVDGLQTPIRTDLPVTPAPLFPGAGQPFAFTGSQDLTITLQWGAETNIAGYDVQVSQTDLFTGLIAHAEKIAKNRIELRIPNSIRKQHFFWRVRSVDASGNTGPWSAVMHFFVQPHGSRPVINLAQPPPSLRINYLGPFLPQVRIEGKTDKNVSLTVNGEPIDVRSDGSFVHTYKLKQHGMNELVFIAEDPEGVQTSVTQIVPYP